MRAGDIVYFSPDRTDFGGLAAVETHTFVEHAAAHSLFLNVVVIALYERSFLLAFLFGKRFYVFLADGVEAVVAPVLVGAAGLGYGVGFVVAFVVHVLAEVLVVHLMAVFALHSGFCFLGKLHLSLALLLDGVVGGFQGSQKFLLGNLVHFAFHHHDVVVGCAYHQVHVGFLKLLEGGVDNEFAVDAGHTHFRDGPVEWDIAHGNRG